MQERALPTGPGPRPLGSAGTVGTARTRGTAGTGRDGGDSARPKGTVASCVLSRRERPPTSSRACGSPAAQERWPHGASLRGEGPPAGREAGGRSRGSSAGSGPDSPAPRRGCSGMVTGCCPPAARCPGSAEAPWRTPSGLPLLSLPLPTPRRAACAPQGTHTPKPGVQPLAPKDPGSVSAGPRRQALGEAPRQSSKVTHQLPVSAPPYSRKTCSHSPHGADQ